MSKQKTPEIRFKGFSGDWEEKKLEDVATMKARIGWQGLKQKEFLDEGDYYLITGTDFDNGKIDFKNCHYITKARYTQDLNIQVKNGDVLITKDGTIGKVAFVSDMDKPTTLNAGVFIIKGKDGNTSNLYLYNYLAAPYLLDYAYKQATGGTIKHLNQNVLVAFPVPLPRIAEQTQIGNFFKTLDNLIALNQRKYDKLVNVKKSCLEKMFPKNGTNKPEVRFKGFDEDWERRTLGEFGPILMNRRIFKCQTLDDGEIPFYKIGTFGGTPDAFISRDLFDEYKLKHPYPQKGDILLSASGSIGRMVEYTGKDEYFQDSNIVWLKHGENLNNSFLKQFYLIVRWEGLEGSTIKRLYNKNILKTEINTPNLPEQTKIGDFFKTLDKLISLRKTELDKLKNIKKSCLEKMFI